MTECWDELNYHDGIYDELVDHPEDSKEGWRLGEACVAKRDNHWYRYWYWYSNREKWVQPYHYSITLPIL